MSRGTSGALAGAFAAFVWGAAEPLLQRAFRTPYSDIRLLGRTLTDGPHWRAAGLAVHAVGDCVAPRRVEHAVHEAHAAARLL